jgi:hypothetical protein
MCRMIASLGDVSVAGMLDVFIRMAIGKVWPCFSEEMA